MKILILSKSYLRLVVPLILLFSVVGIFSATTASASDIAIYKFTLSGRTTTYEENLTGPAAEARSKRSSRTDLYVIYHLPTASYRLIQLISDRTPEGRRKRYFSLLEDRFFNSIVKTNGESRRNYLVLSLFGTGAGDNYSETGEFMSTTIETAAGRIRNQRIRTVLGGVIEMEVPSTLSGPYYSEVARVSAQKNTRELGIGKTRMRLDKRLTGAVNGFTLEEALAAVGLYLESRGYENG